MLLTRAMSITPDESAVAVFRTFVVRVMFLQKQLDSSDHDDIYLRDRLTTPVEIPNITVDNLSYITYLFASAGEREEWNALEEGVDWAEDVEGSDQDEDDIRTYIGTEGLIFIETSLSDAPFMHGIT